jgi:hypothetical protein
VTWWGVFDDIIDYLSGIGGVLALFARAPKDRFSLARFIIEQLVWRDIYASLTRPDWAPRILAAGDFELFMQARSWSRSDDEWESFERMFGEPASGRPC